MLCVLKRSPLFSLGGCGKDIDFLQKGMKQEGERRDDAAKAQWEANVREKEVFKGRG